ncbi:MAG: LytTR family DNA-binding domain-containing protein [Lachnospiraceae bacterium]|nr:LytTR family DNA-binding domain-containing protein [Lachnospiraceae bacterium]
MIGEKLQVEAVAGKRLSLLLCDDEKAQLDELRRLLEEAGETADSIAESTCPESLLPELLRRAECGESMPDVLFLDIRMPEVDGIAFGKKLRSAAPDLYIVFTTAYEEYAVAGYEARAFRYLLKPLKTETLQALLMEIRNDMSRRRRPVVRLTEGERLVPVDELIYLSAENKYTVLYTADGYFLDRTPLSEYEALLRPYGFSRIHRKYLVNLRHHKSLEKGWVTLNGGFRLPVSRRREAAYFTELFDSLGKGVLP